MFHGHSSNVTLVYFLLALSFGFAVCLAVKVLESPENETIRKEMIKLQILQRLGLNEKPHVDQAHKLSKDLALEILKRTDTSATTGTTEGDDHSNSTKPEDDNNFAKTSEIISFPDKGPVLNGHTLLSFSYAGNNAYGVGVRVKKAHLWVKMGFLSSIGRHFGHLLHPKGVTLYVFQVNDNFSNKKQALNHTVHLTSQDVHMELVVSRTIMMDSLGWQKLDISHIVQKWYNKNSRHRIRHGNHHGKNHQREKLTLLVDCAGCANSIHPITFSQSNAVIIDRESTESESHRTEPQSTNSEATSPRNEGTDGILTGESLPGEKNDENEIPFLVLETESAPNSKRNRRRALECGPRVKHCCKQRFYVSFRELGWDDWIIAPKGYYANYCRGSCGGQFRTPDTFLNYHTHVMEEYKRTSEGQSNLEGITPCCAPTKFAPISLIYFGPDYNIIKRDLPKMIVEECGCP